MVGGSGVGVEGRRSGKDRRVLLHLNPPLALILLNLEEGPIESKKGNKLS